MCIILVYFEALNLHQFSIPIYRLFGFESLNIVALIFVHNTEVVFSIEFVVLLFVFRDFFCYHFFLWFWRCFKMSKPSTEIVFLWIPRFLKTWIGSAWLCCQCCITGNIFSHQKWILWNFIIHPSVTHSSIAFASKNEFLRNGTTMHEHILLTVFIVWNRKTRKC